MRGLNGGGSFEIVSQSFSCKSKKVLFLLVFAL